jgi:hypothetical protein
MAQAFGNVIKNATEAIEAAERQTGEGRVHQNRAREDGDSIRIDVIDNGKGLPRENRQRLLEPYMTTREKGTGLGLAIVKKIVEDHGGQSWNFTTRGPARCLDAVALSTGRARKQGKSRMNPDDRSHQCRGGRRPGRATNNGKNPRAGREPGAQERNNPRTQIQSRDGRKGR